MNKDRAHKVATIIPTDIERASEAGLDSFVCNIQLLFHYLSTRNVKYKLTTRISIMLG